MKRKLIIATSCLWSGIAVWLCFEAIMLTHSDIDQGYLLHVSALTNTTIVASVITLITWTCYHFMPNVAGCMILAKNHEYINMLANYSSALYFDVVCHGGYKKLYRKGVQTYNVVCRGHKYEPFKLRAGSSR